MQLPAISNLRPGTSESGSPWYFCANSSFQRAVFAILIGELSTISDTTLQSSLVKWIRDNLTQDFDDMRANHQRQKLFPSIEGKMTETDMLHEVIAAIDLIQSEQEATDRFIRANRRAKGLPEELLSPPPIRRRAASWGSCWPNRLAVVGRDYC